MQFLHRFILTTLCIFFYTQSSYGQDTGTYLDEDLPFIEQLTEELTSKELEKRMEELLNDPEWLRELDNIMNPTGWPRFHVHYVDNKYCFCKCITGTRIRADGRHLTEHDGKWFPLSEKPLEIDSLEVSCPTICDPGGEYEAIINPVAGG